VLHPTQLIGHAARLLYYYYETWLCPVFSHIVDCCQSFSASTNCSQFNTNWKY